MKKFFIITGIILVSLIAILYLAILFVVPNVVSVEKYKPEIQKLAQEQANLKVDFDNAKITITPMLSAGIKADKLSVQLPDESNFIRVDNLIVRVSLPHLLFKTIKVTKAECTNPIINVDIDKDNEYKVVTAITQALEQQQNTEKKEEETSTDNPSFKINIPEIKLINYNLYVNDLITNDFLNLKGNELLAGYNGKNVYVKSIAELFLNEQKNITANIDVNTVIPQFDDNSSEKKQRNTNENKEEININPVAIYKTYDLKTNIDTKLKIKQKDNLLVSDGYLKIDNFTLKLDGIQLPESKLHITSNGTKVTADSELYVTKEEKLSLLAMADYGKNSQTEVKIKSNEIHVANVLELIYAALNSANIKSELDTIKSSGFFVADAYFKTDFKTLTSNGKITVDNVELINKKDNFKIAKINSILSLDDNILKFINTTVEVLGSIFKVEGTINQESIADISIVTEKLPVESLINMFAPAEIKKTYNVNSGIINLNALIKGELKNPTADLKASLNNLSLTDKINKISYINSILTADFTSDFKTYNGNLKNNDFRLSMEGIDVRCNNLEAKVNADEIEITPSKLTFNGVSDINFSGKIKEYAKNPIFNIDAKGAIPAQAIKQLLGKEISIYFANKGNLPIDIKISGDSKTQTLTANLEADANNYVTPINLSDLLNKKSVFKLIAELKGDSLAIKESGLFLKGQDKDTEIIGIDGTISKLTTKTPVINMIKVKIPNDNTGSICIFPKSSVVTKGNLYVTGELSNPNLRGNFDFRNLSIPEIYVTMDNAVANIEGNALDININKLMANGSDYNMVINADLAPSENFTIKNLNVISNHTDSDKVLKVTEALDKMLPKPQTSNSTANSTSKNNNSQNNLPVVIKAGTIDIKEIKSGTILLTETTGKISMVKNIFNINNLITSAFNGKITGDVGVNLVTSDIKANVKGSGMNVEKTLLDTAAMKDTLTGTMDFTADISLRGSTFEEQVKTLKGNVNFDIKNGTLGPFGRIENLIIADNVRQNPFFKTALGSTINQITKFDTTHFNSLTGKLSFNNGIAQINPITTSGDIMSTYIFGSFDVLKNTIDVTLRARLGSQVSESLGTLSLINPINLSKKATAINPLLGNVFVLFTQQVTDSELAQIPKLGKEYSDTNTTRFQTVLKGDAAKPANCVKSFKWLALKSEIEAAQESLGAANLGITSLNKEELKNAAKNKLTENLTDEQKKQLKQAQDVVKTVKTMASNKEEVKNTIKEQAKQAKSSLLNQLKEQAQQALTVPADDSSSKK